MKKIAIIGAGLSAMTLAHYLKEYAEVSIFEKARGVGGRMASRRADPFFFDHGAQFFIAKTDIFKEFLQYYIKQEIVKEWHANFVEFDKQEVISTRKWSNQDPHYVAVPGMNALVKSMSIGLDIKLNTRVLSFYSVNNKWNIVTDKDEYGEFDWVISTAPAEQTTELMPRNFKYKNQISSKKMLACFSLMLGFNKNLNIDFDAALVKNADISWISVNSSKPNRVGNQSLLVHSTNLFAEKYIDDDKQVILNHLQQETANILQNDLNDVDYQNIHAWRYANIGKQNGNEFYIDLEHNLASCGDWCIHGRVESAFISAYKLASEMLCYLK